MTMKPITDVTMRMIRSLTMTSWQRLLIGFILYILPIILFAKLASEVREQETLPFDNAVLEVVHHLATPQLDSIIPLITQLGFTWAIAIMLLVIMWLCVRRRRYREAVLAVISVGGSALINLVLKVLFQRDRPDLWQRLVTENSHSFPSGHAMASASITILCIVILWNTKWRNWALFGGAAYMVVIGFTRLYLGVHYPTDILAGWLVTSAWVVIAALAIRKFPGKSS